jgi:putative DNA primase/helicase
MEQQICRYCGSKTIGSDVCWKCLDNPERQKVISEIRQIETKSSKYYPTYPLFCDNPQDADSPEKLRGFKPARVAQYLAREEHFKTDRKTDVLFYGDFETGKWIQNGETKLAEILAVILGEENRSIHYTNILHSLKGLTYCDVEFSKKLSCDNGILDPEKLEFKDPNMDEMTVYSVTCAYDPEAKSEHWQEFLKQVVASEDVPTLQEWSGYLLLPDYRFHKLLWIHGEGRNGKGVWQRTMEGILGSEMVSGLGLEEFDGYHRFALNQLYGKLFNPCSEPTTNHVLQTALLKKATGQDTISAECKGTDKRIDFRNAAKITVIANRFPKVKDSTTAFRERRLFIKFPNDFTGKDCIVNLELAWLEDPKEKSGILNWMLEGLQRLLAQGYFTEGKSQEETEIAFERASDSVSSFLKEMGIFNRDAVTLRSYAFDLYKEYCEVFGLDQESDKKFAQVLKETRGITPCRKGTDRAWRGIEFKNLSEDGEITDSHGTGSTDSTRILPYSRIAEQREILEEYSTRVRNVQSVLDNPEVPPDSEDKCRDPRQETS